MQFERRDKKSDSIKVRVPWTLKRDFMAKARHEGRSVSDIFRDFMEDYLTRPAQRTTQTLETAMTAIRKRPRTSAGAAAILGAAAISAVLSSAIPAGAARDLRAEFERMDGNGDGVVSAREMRPTRRAPDLRFERGADGVSAIGLPSSGNLADGFVKVRIGDGDRAPGSEKVGPILLPAAGADGEAQLVMLEIRRHFGDTGRGFEMLAPTSLEATFEDGDADGSGALSFEEFEANYRAVRGNSFNVLDTDGDSVISAAEIDMNPVDGPEIDFAANALRGIDADGDGRVTRAEYEDAV